MNFYSYVYYYLIGYLKIECFGDFPERLFNILAANEVRFWDIKKYENKFTFYIKKKDILKLKHARRKIGVKVKIIERNGFPKIVKRYRNRYGIAVGAAIFLILINVASTRLWNIQINGNDLVDKTHILNFLNNNGIKVGISLDKIDTERLEQLLILSSDNISRASLNKQGSVLQVNISEFDDSKSLNKTPCNLIASNDGIISEINLNTGRCLVKEGDTVSKGQVLVTGILIENNMNVFIESDAQIYALVPDNISIEIEKKIKEKIFYKNESRKVLEFLSFKIPLYFGDCKGNYEKITKVKNLEMFGGEIPIKIYEANYSLFYYDTVEIDKNTALQKGREEISQKLISQGAKSVEIIRDELIDNGENYIYKATIRKNIDITNKDFLKISDENT